MCRLLIKSKIPAPPNAEQRKKADDATYKKLKAALEGRVVDATNERDKARALQDLEEFTAASRRGSAQS